MSLLVLGVLLWMAAHLFKRIAPGPRAALGNAGRGLVALGVLGSVVLMVIAYRGADYVALYTPPGWGVHLNNLLMLIAVFLLGVGKAGGVVGAKLRHPMLLGVVIWAIAHLLVNGDLASLILFAGLGLWAVIEMLTINAAEGPWTPPAKGPVAKDAKVAVIALVLYAAIAGVHYWMGYPVFGAGA
ncbi:hypothetical protein DDZ14_17975 [Maritimibacter sp. 55A14]|uniref:NnrU family protein n=1 Tax=Maritimibacter sp. 55A14 TaxID=2174844 RepID=UPI000D61A061|nr:NnrU family protein [Maritimibacter sp. 55A14]PWE29272.1 hypothetical protein DDZ14_17975 [Maritimibacter sp. 55A14]